MAQKGPIVNEFRFKFVLLGDCETGKTAIKNQLCDNKFLTQYKPTLGLEDSIYRGETEQGRFQVVVYDTSGQERFRKLSYQNVSTSQAIFFVYDVNNPTTLEGLESRIKEVVEQKEPPNLQKVLLGNKNDLLTTMQAEKTKDRALEFARRYNLIKRECSAKSRDSLIQVINEVVRELIKIQMLNSGTTVYDDEAGKTFKSTFKGRTEAGRTEMMDITGKSYRSVIDEEAEYTKQEKGQKTISSWKMKGDTTQQSSETTNLLNGKNANAHMEVTIEGPKESRCGGCNCKIF